MKPRPFVALLMLIAIPPLIGALIAPQVNAHLIPALHRAWPHVSMFLRKV